MRGLLFLVFFITLSNFINAPFNFKNPFESKKSDRVAIVLTEKELEESKVWWLACVNHFDRFKSLGSGYNSRIQELKEIVNHEPFGYGKIVEGAACLRRLMSDYGRRMPLD